MSVVIIGAGTTGLSAAWALLRQGAAVDVYEAAPDIAGLAGTFERDGFFFDYGPHELCPRQPEVLAFLEALCGDDLLTVDKRITQHFAGRYVRYPFEVVDVLRNIGPWLGLRACAEVVTARLSALRSREPARSFKEWTSRRFGRTLYERYFGPYTEKVWGIDPDELDPRTAEQRITIDSVWDLLKKTVTYQIFGSEDRKHPHSEYRRTFRYVRGGIGRLAGKLQSACEEMGARMHVGAALTQVDRGADGGIRRLGFADGTTIEEPAHVVSTIPLPRLVELVHGARGTDLVRSYSLPFRGMVFCFLRLDRPRVRDEHWIYFPDSDIPFQRMTEFVHFDSCMAPGGKTGVALEIASNPGDGIWEAADNAIVEKCVAALRRLDLIDGSEVIGADIIRRRHAYPLQVRGFPEKTGALLGSLEDVGNLTTIGRQGLFRYCNMDECIEMALDVAPRIIAGDGGVRYIRPTSWAGVAVTDRVK